MLSPKEKAKELINKFVKVECLQDFEGMDLELAKDCALILCDEMIEESIGYLSISRNKYWEEAKTEVKNFKL